MNKKGFTLVELLAVIIILSLLALLASTAVTKIVKDSKKDLSNTQLELIKSAAEVWGADNLSQLPSSGECGYLTLEDLQKSGSIDSNIINPETNEVISPDLKIKVSTKNNYYGNPKITYEVNPDSIEGCSHIMYGDVNLDGEVTIEDAQYLFFYTFYPEEYPLVDQGKKNADANKDGSITSEDSVTIVLMSNLVDISSFPENTGSIIYGDVDEDGKVTIEDAKYLVFYTFYPEEYPLTSQGENNADVNKDGEITIEDAKIIQMHVDGMI